MNGLPLSPLARTEDYRRTRVQPTTTIQAYTRTHEFQVCGTSSVDGDTLVVEITAPRGLDASLAYFF